VKNSVHYPLISVGIPTYNRSLGLIKTLASVFKQNYPSIEIIVSDNCSTDSTQHQLNRIGKLYSEVQYYRQSSNIGMIANFEFVLRKAKGKYFMWVADDDELESNVLVKYVDFLESHPGYSLVSGEIKYWLNTKQDLSERGFTFEQKSSTLRVINYYAKVVYGGMIHGLMRREFTHHVHLRKAIGNDYHFIANMAFLGEIKHFDFVGYHKNFGGTSKNFKQYAKHIGDSSFAGNFPHLKMACDAFLEVMSRSSVYASMPLHARFTLAISVFSGMIMRYYGGIYPFMIGGKVKRFLLHPPTLKINTRRNASLKKHNDDHQN
jgi:glycosyltransferase involved in cell wall biosynthesis